MGAGIEAHDFVAADKVVAAIGPGHRSIDFLCENAGKLICQRSRISEVSAICFQVVANAFCSFDKNDLVVFARQNGGEVCGPDSVPVSLKIFGITGVDLIVLEIEAHIAVAGEKEGLSALGEIHRVDSDDSAELTGKDSLPSVLDRAWKALIEGAVLDIVTGILVTDKTVRVPGIANGGADMLTVRADAQRF